MNLDARDEALRGLVNMIEERGKLADHGYIDERIGRARALLKVDA